MRASVFIAAVLSVTASVGHVSAAAGVSPVDYVNPIIGVTTHDELAGATDGLGKTFPGVCTPYGLVQLSPDTKTGGDNGSGYSWHHKTIEGFSFTHMSGVGWYGDLGNFLVMPTVGPLKTFKGTEDEPERGYRSRFSHDRECARIDRYAVMLDDYGIKAELAAAPRSGMIRFTYPEADTARIQIDLARRIGGSSTLQRVEVVNDSVIRGYMKCPPEGGGWGDGWGGADYTVYFYCVFSRPMTDYGMWSADIPDGWSRKNSTNDDPVYHSLYENAEIIRDRTELEGKHIGFFTEFPSTEGMEVALKCGISFVDMEGARRNLEADMTGMDFDRVCERSRALWERSLSKVKVESGNDDDLTVFYTSLYHTMIDPRCFSAADGRYHGADGRIHEADGFVYRTIFSGWDVFRSQFPLQTVINPSLVEDELNSLVQIAELSGRGYFPRWEFLNSYSGCMVGNPAVSVLADAFNKGLRGYDTHKAIRYAVNTQRRFSNGEAGFVPGDLSSTLEYAYTDRCVSMLLDSVGCREEAAEFARKSQSYRSVWCDSVGWFRARDDSGAWTPWKSRLTFLQGCVESNNYQQGWFVPHDIAGLKSLMGEERMLSELEAFFNGADSRFTWGDYYNHPNEPDHHVPFMFNYTSKPWLTQYWTRRICRNAYGADVNGLCGNEDVGQMSAWYVLASLGFHPVCPGVPRYELTSPVFDRAQIALDPKYYQGGTFTIIARDNSPENVYIQSVTLNGNPLDRLWITHAEIVNGGTLELVMGPRPNEALRGHEATE